MAVEHIPFVNLERLGERLTLGLVESHAVVDEELLLKVLERVQELLLLGDRVLELDGGGVKLDHFERLVVEHAQILVR